MVLTIIEIDGSETIVSCLTSYLHPEECAKYHRGMLGCNPECPHLKKKGDTKISKKWVIKNKVITQLKIIKNLLAQVPKDIAPEEDNAINFYKAQEYVNKILRDYPGG